MVIINNTFMKRRILMILIAVLSAALLLIIGAVIGMNLQTNTPQTSITPNSENEDEALVDPIDTDSDTDTDEETNGTEETDVMLDFASDRYNIQFSYPEELGSYDIDVDTLYFFNETITFTDSDLRILYVRWEGSHGIGIDKEEEGSVTTKQGYTGSYYITKSAIDSGFTLSVTVPSPGTNGTRLSLTTYTSTLASAQEELGKIQSILDTLEFDFSNVPLDGCEVSCR